jgi:hypothetical protein
VSKLKTSKNRTSEIPEKLVTMGKDGVVNKEAIHDIIEWDIEVIERKHEDKIKSIEGLVKKMGKKFDDG